jgi:hypothetical protein
VCDRGLRYRPAQRLRVFMRPQRVIATGVLGVVLGCGTVAPADEGAVAPRLDDIERHSPPSAPPEPNSAQPLPETVTICQDDHSQRCWTEHGAATCRSEGVSSGKVFRRTGSNNNPGQALEACWAALRR